MLIESLGLSVDSLVACLAIAPLLPRTGADGDARSDRVPDRLALAAALGAADGAATFAASVGGAALYIVAVAIAAAALVLAVRWPGHRRLGVLPLVLSIDNLAVPLAPGDVALEPVVTGATSFAMAMLGFAASNLVFRIIPIRLHRPTAIAIAGAALLTITLG